MLSREDKVFIAQLVRNAIWAIYFVGALLALGLYTPVVVGYYHLQSGWLFSLLTGVGWSGFVVFAIAAFYQWREIRRIDKQERGR